MQSEQVALEFRHIRSPIDAIIDRVYKHKGEYVEEGERILVLHDESLLWLEASIDENEIRHVAVGQPVRVHLHSRPYLEYAGRVSQIGSATIAELGISQETGRQFGRPAERGSYSGSDQHAGRAVSAWNEGQYQRAFGRFRRRQQRPLGQGFFVRCSTSVSRTGLSQSLENEQMISSDYVIVGGGVYGAALAYELARAGREVCLLEANEIACGASGGLGQARACARISAISASCH